MKDLVSSLTRCLKGTAPKFQSVNSTNSTFSSCFTKFLRSLKNSAHKKRFAAWSTCLTISPMFWAIFSVILSHNLAQFKRWPSVAGKSSRTLSNSENTRCDASTQLYCSHFSSIRSLKERKRQRSPWYSTSWTTLSSAQMRCKSMCLRPAKVCLAT